MEQHHGIEDHDGPEHPALDNDGQDHDGGADVRAFVQSRRAELEGQLAEWVRVPGVLGDPEHTKDLLRSANWLAAAFREVGFPVVEILPTGESHAVYAEWCEAPGAPTVLVYSHHDVRVAKPEQWDQTAPFEPVVRDGRLYGRGSSDAKGQVLAHLWGLRAHLDQQSKRSITSDPQNPDALSLPAAETTALSHSTAPAINLKYLVEGEEEGGSPHLAKLLKEQSGRFQADLVVFSDTLLFREDHPALCVSLRGMVSAHLEVTGPEVDVHSGAVSGSVPNPAFEISRVLAGHTLSVDLETAQEPYWTPDHPAVFVLERAMARGFRSPEVGRMGNAGGGPATLLAKSLDASVLFFGTGLVEDHWHDSDESANLGVLVNGAVTLACFWDELARME